MNETNVLNQNLFSLSSAQKRLWFLWNLDTSNTAYNMPSCIQIEGSLDYHKLKQSLEIMVQRHQMMRANFIEKDGEPWQFINPHLPVELVLDEKDEQEWQIFAETFLEKPFNLKAEPLFRFCLLKISETKHIFIACFHHIIGDGISLNLFFSELGNVYTALINNDTPQLSDLKADYFDFINYAAENVCKDDFLNREQTLVAKLLDKPSLIDLPVDKPYCRQNLNAGDIVFKEISGDLKGDVTLFCRQNNITPFMFYLGVFVLLLNKLTNSDKMLIGIPFASRLKQDFQNIFGYFVNTLVLAFDLSPDFSFKDLLNMVKKEALQALDNQDIPLDNIINKINPERTSERNPLVQVMFSFQSNLKNIQSFKTLKTTFVPPPRKSSIFELTLDVADNLENLLFYLEYNSNLFAKQTAENICCNYARAIKACLLNPLEKIVKINILSEEDNNLMLSSTMNKPLLNKLPQSITTQITTNNGKTPDKTAIYFKDIQISHQQLNQMTSSIAQALITEGVVQGDTVGLCMPSCEWQIPSILGIMKTGAVFVPIDDKSPKERIEFIVKDAGIKHIITKADNNLKTIFPYLKFITPSITDTVPVFLEKTNHNSDDTAYIIYTSGTTGQPKGVKVSHLALENHCLASIDEYQITADDCSIFFASLFFDASLEQILPVLLCGGSIVQRDNLWSAEEFFAKIADFKVTIADVPPLYLRELIENCEKPIAKSLRMVIAGGEALPLDVAKKWFNSPLASIPLINAYGPTEAVITSTIYRVDAKHLQDLKTIPIGSAFAGRKLFILNQYNQPVIKGSYGELCIGGDCLAQGYLNAPELTAQKFTAFEGERLYRSGDLVRVNHLGLLEFRGRIDRQIKIRGFRIEAGDVENALNQHSQIKACYVKENKGSLVAYIVSTTPDLAVNELLPFLSSKIPEYMLPQDFVVIDKIPMSTTGKVDEKALPDIVKTIKIISEETLSEGQQKISAIWEEVLGHNKFGLYDNFFEVGGHSLLLLKLHAKLKKAFDTDIKTVDLFNYPNIATQSSYLFGTSTNISSFNNYETVNGDDIAIIGIACRFPDADTPEDFWQNLTDGKESVRYFNKKDLQTSGLDESLIDNPSFVPAHAPIENHDCFDFNFFGYSFGEAKTIDPQQRIFLEESYHALENGGYDPFRYPNRIGVFAGMGTSVYFLNNLIPNRSLDSGLESFQLSMGNDKDFLPMRVSYKLNLRGPSVNINTACSSSLVAVHTACQSLGRGECEMALAGGVTIQTIQKSGYIYQQDGIMSPDGHCRAFADDANGTVGGSGCGVVLLKRLKDAQKDNDQIYAVIKASAINNDGNLKVGFTAPSVQGQSAVIEDTYNIAKINPETISYIETHGTATKLGDPIEIEALSKVFNKYTDKKSFCAIGSVKTNIGHLDTAAGIAGLIKTALALKYQKIPPSLNCTKPSQTINFERTPFLVNTHLKEWHSESTRRAGVSSFGMGGTNAHILLEEFILDDNHEKNSDEEWVLPISAETEEALQQYINKLAIFITNNKNLNPLDVFYTLAMGRKECRIRKIFTAPNRSKIISKLKYNQNEASSLSPDLEQWQKGKTILWDHFFTNKKCQRITLPNYCFAKIKCWIDAPRKTSPEVITKQPLDNWFYHNTWSEIDNDNIPNSFNENSCIILHKGSPNEQKILSAFQQEYQIKAQELENFDVADIKRILDDNNNPTHLIYLPAVNDFNNLEESYDSYFQNILNVAKTIALSNIKTATISVITQKLVKLTTGFILPQKSLILGALRTISKEYPNIHCQCFDVANNSPLTAKTVLNLKSNDLIAIGQKIKVRKTTPNTLTKKAQTMLANNGCYIVIGGTGGIGFTLCEHLVSSYNANLAILTRTPLSDDDIRLQSLKKYGTNIISVACDITESSEIKQAFAKSYHDLGRIDGIIHSAGFTSGTIIASLTKEQALNVMKTKIEATPIIYQTALKYNPKFIMLCSSLTGVLGEKGQASYTASNAFLDAFAEEYHQKDGINVISIAWDMIAQRGMGARVIEGKNPSLREIFKKAISPQNSWVLSEHILNGKNTMPATGYIDFVANFYKDKYPICIKDLTILRKLSLESFEETKLNLNLAENKDGICQFTITSNSTNNEIEHTTGFISYPQKTLLSNLDLDNIKSKMELVTKAALTNQDDADFKVEAGKRWVCDNTFWLGKNNALINLKLNNNFYDDLKKHCFHPALADIATAFYLVKIPNAQDFIPFNFGKIELFAPLEAEIYSYCQLTSEATNLEKIVMNISITDKNGKIIAVISDYTLINKKGIKTALSEFIKNTSKPQYADNLIQYAIQKPEVIEVFERALSQNEPVVIISTIAIDTVKNKDVISNQKHKPDTAASPFEILQQIITELMEINDIKPQDDIFALGADSFIALQIASKIKDKTGVDVPLDRFFASPTIAELTKYLDANMLNKKEYIEAVNTDHKKDIITEFDLEKPLSFPEQRIFMLKQIVPTSAVFNIAHAFKLTGELNLDVLQKAFAKIVRRHQILRTSFVEKDNKQIRVINEISQIDCTFFDFSKTPNSLDSAKNAIIKFSNYVFDLGQAPLLKYCLCKISDTENIVTILIHHIIADGWSIAILLDELAFYYNNLLINKDDELPPLNMQYSDFAVWQRQHLTNDFLNKKLDFWQQKLKDFPAITTIPTDYPRPPEQSFAGKSIELQLEEKISNKIKELAKNNKISLNTLFISVYAVLIHSYTNQTDIVLGIPTAGRNQDKHQNLIGMFVNMLPVRIILDLQLSFKELTTIISQKIGEIMSNAEIPFEYLIAKLNVERNLSITPLFQNVINFMPPLKSNNIFGNCKLDFIKEETSVSKYDLSIYVEELNNKIVASIEYASKLYQQQTIENVIDVFKNILECVIDNFETPLNELNGVSPKQQELLLTHWQSPEQKFEQKTIAELVFDTASKNPSTPAVIDNGKIATYEELTKDARQMASFLKTKGLNNGAKTIVLMERSYSMICSMLSIMTAGGVYVPVTLDTPLNRLKYIVKDSNSKILLYNGNLSAEVEEELSKEMLLIDVSKEDFKNYELYNNNFPAFDDPAYLIYTSGSTGTPKGVLVSSKGFPAIVDLLKNFGIKNGDNVAQTTTPMFDASVLEIWGNLAIGSTLHIMPNTYKLEPEKIKNWITVNNISCTLITTAIAEQLYELDWSKNNTFKKLLLGGEASTKRPPSSLPFKCFNLYGPTENTVVSTYQEIKPSGENLPEIGRALKNVKCYVLNQNLRPSPIGGIGELYLGGNSLALKYLGNEKITNEAFFYWSPQTFKKGAEQPNAIRVYKTGDLVRYDTSGKLHFISRKDGQIKIRGYRIELGEIEAVLMKHHKIKSAFAKIVTRNNEKYLVSWIETKSDSTIPEIKSFLTTNLPSYMIPSHIVLVDKMPITNNGKIDLKALPNAFAATQTYNEPKNLGKTEALIVQIWQNLTGTAIITENDNFFDIGGHSLMLAKVSNLLLERTGKKIDVIDLFRYPTVAKLANFIESDSNISNNITVLSSNPKTSNAIAVIGMAGRFPEADNVNDFWQNLLDGKNSISFFNKDELLQAEIPLDLIDDENYVPANGVLNQFEFFDADFFGISPQEATLMDPQQRLLLETAWHTLEDAGYNPDNYNGLIGIYAGVGFNSYFFENILSNQDVVKKMGSFQVMMLNEKDFAATKVAYKLNLKGPALNINTGCSTSLVAIHSAVTALLNDECNIALAGGAKVNARQIDGYLYEEGSILSKSGYCSAFDEKADGTVVGNGVALVALKRLEDAVKDNDNIYAVIKGSALSNDGFDKIGFTAPSIDGQKQAITSALAKSGFAPETITYVETHGTGTALGDPIEFTALKETLNNSNRKNPCVLGAVKTNIGHLDAAAGVAGFIKTVKSLQTGLIPKNCNFNKPNQKLSIEPNSFIFPKETINWSNLESARRAGVSSFGIGGTNAHILLEQAPDKALMPASDKPKLLLLSGKKEETVNKQITMMNNFFSQKDSATNLDNVAYTLALGRKHFEFRKAFVGKDIEEIKHNLELASSPITTIKNKKTVFMFTGQGSQHIGMAKELYEKIPAIKNTLDVCFELANPLLGKDLKNIIFGLDNNPETNNLMLSTAYIQPSLFIVEYALAKYFMEIGIIPDAMIGHSIGEWVASCLAGVFNLKDALAMVILRGKLMSQCPKGKMLAIALSENGIEPHLNNNLNIAAINAEDQTVVAGTNDAIDNLKQKLLAQNIRCSDITSLQAFHSFMMEDALKPFAEALINIKTNTIKIPIISNLSGKFLTDDEAESPSYWTKQIRNPVRFADGIKTLTDNNYNLFVEIGPARVLSSLAIRNNSFKNAFAIATLRKQNSDYQDLLEAIGAIWEKGLTINWQKFYENQNCYKTPLPLYPFDSKYFFIGKKPPQNNNTETENHKNVTKVKTNQSTVEIILEAMADILGHEKINADDDFFDIGGDSLVAVQLTNILKTEYNIKLPPNCINIAGTPTKIADAVLENNDGQSSFYQETSPIIEMIKGQKQNSKLFFIHAIGGGAFVFRDLIKEMGNTYPSYGLSAPGLWNDEPALKTIEDLADFYIKTIEHLCKDEPITLIGYSFGGYVAYEMALRIKKQGLIKINSVLLLDTPAPQYNHGQINDKKDLFAYLLDRDDIGKNFAYNKAKMANMTEDECFVYVLNEIKTKWTGHKNMTLETLKRQIKVLVANFEAMKNYFPQKSSLQLTFMKAEQQDNFNDNNPHHIWQEYAQGGINVINVNGNHSSMLSPPNTKKLAQKILEHIRFK